MIQTEQKPVAPGTRVCSGPLGNDLVCWRINSEDRLCTTEHQGGRSLLPLKQYDIDWLLSERVEPRAIIHPVSVLAAVGHRASDGRFDFNDDGTPWFAFTEQRDTVFWCPVTGQIATDAGRAFALGEDLVDNPATTALDQYLCIYVHPLTWLRNGRDGIVVLRWDWAFENLRDVTHIAIAEELLATYRKSMRPCRMPKLAVLSESVRGAG